MRKWLFLIHLSLLVLSPSISQGQDEKDTTPEAPIKLEKTPGPTEEKLYRFQSTTVWGELNLLIRDLQGRFQVVVKSGSPASGWILKEGKTGRTILKGGLDSASQFQFEVNRPFQDSFRLTVFLNSDQEQIPVVVPFSADQENQSKNAGLEGLEDFQENPDHPYNKMVKNLYEKALQDYAQNDIRAALEHLRQAEELDPTQAQVQSMLEKIQGPSEETSSDSLDKIRNIFKKGNKEEALAKADDYLDENPDDSEGLELKNQIEGKENSQSAVKIALAEARKAGKAGKNSEAMKWYSKVLKLDPQNGEATEALRESVSKPVSLKKQVNLNDSDAQAQADQSYNLGLESYRRGDYAGAKKFWQETLQIQPNHPQARRNLDRLAEEHPELK